jgi:hypothetical protein
MDELLALQQELAQVQSAKAGFKLSEPNVVEVVQKLAELGMLDVLYTSNGKEYVTPKRLNEEVADEILAHGGRINITELPPILNVDLTYIERAVDQLLKRDGSLQLVQGEIIATYYLDGLAEDIHQSLQAAGRMTIGDLAMQYNFTSEFVQQLVEPRLGTLSAPRVPPTPHTYALGRLRRPELMARCPVPPTTTVDAKLSGHTLYTSAYTDRHAARVRGVLSALTKPASLPQLVREHGFSEARPPHSLAPLCSTPLAPPCPLCPRPQPRPSSTRPWPRCTPRGGCPARCRARRRTRPPSTRSHSRRRSAPSTSRTASSSASPPRQHPP